MNPPATLGGNWRWRFRAEALRPEHVDRLRQLVRIYERGW
jgi:4-alpha-glucanotransferase